MTGPRGTYDALLFDLDGTLVDSMPLHQRAWVRWFDSIGRPLDQDARFFATTAGRTNSEILADMFPGMSAPERDAMSNAKEALYRTEAQQHLQVVAGALDLLVRARERGLKLAVCTAAPLANIQVAFDRFGLGALVDTLTSPADGLRGKPHPDIFEAAASRLGTLPARCLVFEDAPLGVEAARRAGMHAVALTTTLDADAFSTYPNLVTAVSDFTALDHSLLFA
jgi:HAD superfamily hydrolase (TIGR01509 family)